ncbi:MAG: phenolic acid decarboxylase [Pseudomonadota bacterium]
MSNLHLSLFLCSAIWMTSASIYAEESETTRELNGTKITYEYSSGRSYNVKFEEAGVSYRYLTGSKPDTWWGPFPYQAIRVEENLYFASWFEKGYGDYVTLLINFSERKLHGSAILRGEEVHFHSATLVKVEN